MRKTTLLKSILLLCALVVGSGSVWAQSELGLEDFTWPTPIVDENFNSLDNVSASDKVSSKTDVTKHGVFNGLYNNKAENSYGIEDTQFSSKALFLSSGKTTSPIVVGITNVEFGNKGAFSFKCKKTNYGYIGLTGDEINGTAYTKSKASCYMQINNGAITISNGTSWKQVTTVSSGTDVEICIIYNNSSEDLSYGNAISIAKQTCHFYINGELVKDGSSPKAMTIVNAEIASFKVVTCQNNATMNIDDVKIYNELPTYNVPATITAAEYATFCNENYALDFSATGITAYTATDAETFVTLNEITSGKVPANTPVVLYKAGADGTAINVPVIASADAPAGTNDLHVSTGTDVENMYVLSMSKKSGKVGFYKWAGSSDLSAGKVYLQASSSSAPDFLGFDGWTTAVDGVKAVSVESGEYFNLAGQRVAQPTKGLYIVNGKKVVVK